MASGTIKGITIEIEGKTSGLVKSLGDVNKELSLTQKSLKTVDQALKMDPGNVDALKKKQEILNTAIDQTRQKLELEKKAAEDAAKALEDGTITKSQYDALQAEVAKTAAEMNKLEKEAQETDKALDKTAETGRFEKLKGALGKVGNGLQIAAKATGAMVAGATAAAGALLKVTTDAAETADEIDKMSQKIGISKQSYQEWAYVMGQNGMDVDTLQTGMKKLNTEIMKAATSGEATTKAFKKLGVSITNDNGVMRSQEDILYDTIVALADMGEGADRAKLAQELLGKSGSELAPLLNQGSDAIKELTQRSHDLGLIMSDEAVDAGVKLGDTIDDVKKSFKALGTNLGSSLMPIVQKIADKLLEFMPRIQKHFERIGPGLETFLDNMLPMLFDLAETLLPPIYDLLDAIIPSLTEIMNAILPVISDLLKEILPPLIQIVKAILPVLVQLIKMLSPIIDAVAKILGPLIELVLQLIQPLLELINNILKPLTDLFSGVGDVLSTVLGPAINFVGGLLSNVLGPAFEAIGDIVGTVVSLVTGDWEGLSNALEGIWGGLKDFASSIWSEISGIIDSAVEGILGNVNKARDASLEAQQAALVASGALEAQEANRQRYYGYSDSNKVNQLRDEYNNSGRSGSNEAFRQYSQARSTADHYTSIYMGSTRVQTVCEQANSSSNSRDGGR